MKPCNVKDLLQVLKAMGEAEIAMSVLYKVCAKIWEQDSEFWLSLSHDEIKHSEDVKQLARIIHDRIGHQTSFQFHRPFSSKFYFVHNRCHEKGKREQHL